MKIRGLVGAFGALLLVYGLTGSARAMSPDVPGQVLYTYYETTEQFTFCSTRLRPILMAATSAETETTSSV